MKCPNCSAECSDQALECDFCGHPFIAGAETAAPSAPPVMPAPPMSSAQATPPANPYANTVPVSSRASKKDVPNYFVWAIVATIVATLSTMFSCCCIPLGLPSGIAAIVFANKVNSFLAADDISAAEDASKKAKLWTWVTTVIAIIFSLWVVTYFILTTTGVLDPTAMEDILKQMEANR
jgi:lysylphosphatidylglycerol synthetase-like protein (DUF2156 family)